MEFMSMANNGVAEPELSLSEREAYASMLGSLRQSDGWRWIEREGRRLVAAQRAVMDQCPMDANYAMKMAETRGYCRAITQLLELPVNSHTSLMETIPHGEEKPPEV